MAGTATFSLAGSQLSPLQQRAPLGCGRPRRSRGPVSVRGTAAPEAPSSRQAAVADDSTFGERDLKNFLSGYKSQYVEHAYWVEDSMVEGTIPAELSGTLLRNGPALFEIGNQAIPQPFDGDGMAAMFAFHEGRAFFSNRFVRTEAFVQEQQAGKMIFRGAFSTGAPEGQFIFNPFDFSMKKVANTGIFQWGGKILALYEKDLPYELTGADLRTVGRTDLGGAISEDSPWIAAHYRRSEEDDGSERWVAFSAAEAGQDGRLRFWEFGPDLEVLHRTERTLPGAAFGFFHDMALSQSHYVLVENPVRMDLRKLLTEYMWGKSCIAECLVYDPSRKTKVHVFPRPGRGIPSGPDTHRVFETDPFFSFHHGNAYTSADGRSLVVDTVALHDGMNFDINFDRIDPGYYKQNVGRGTFTRLVLDLETGAVAQHRLMDRACEFPCVAPAAVGRPHVHTYMVAARQDGGDGRWGAPQVLCKATLNPEAGVSGPATAAQDLYAPGPDRFAQEPIFVPRAGGEAEDDGWLMSLVYDAATNLTELVILDARSLAAGPVATIKLPHMLPFGLHGSWSDSYLGPSPGAPFSPIEHDIRQGVLRYE